jgi:catechol 2,3-dioxygenase-like lactoylglutathione lyase family enzyme
MKPPFLTDICLITRDIDASVEFYTKKLHFQLSSQMPGFADFVGHGIVLALWDAKKLEETTGVPGQTGEPTGHGVMLAIQVDSPAEVDQAYEDLSARGVVFYGAPKDYPWNTRSIFFAGPSGEFWEFYAWREGGKPGVLPL